MNLTRTHLNKVNFQLQSHAFQHIQNAVPGTVVICGKGLVHLTRPNDLQDYILWPGQQVVIQSKGDVLAEGIYESDLSIIYPN